MRSVCLCAFVLAACSNARREHPPVPAASTSTERGESGASSAPGPAPRQLAAARAGARGGARGADPVSDAVLREALASPDFATRMVAVDALGEARCGVELLGALAVGDTEPEVRLAAVAALARFGTPRARYLLRQVRDDKKEDLDIRATAAGAVLARTPEDEGASR